MSLYGQLKREIYSFFSEFCRCISIPTRKKAQDVLESMQNNKRERSRKGAFFNVIYRSSLFHTLYFINKKTPAKFIKIPQVFHLLNN